jgi:hypothetical protein
MLHLDFKGAHGRRTGRAGCDPEWDRCRATAGRLLGPDRTRCVGPNSRSAKDHVEKAARRWPGCAPRRSSGRRVQQTVPFTSGSMAPCWSALRSIHADTVGLKLLITCATAVRGSSRRNESQHTVRSYLENERSRPEGRRVQHPTMSPLGMRDMVAPSNSERRPRAHSA